MMTKNLLVVVIAIVAMIAVLFVLAQARPALERARQQAVEMRHAAE